MDDTFLCEVCHRNVPLMNELVHKARCKMNSKSPNAETTPVDNKSETSAPSNSPPSSSSSINLPRQPADQTNMWTCSRCTLINSVANAHCDACGASFDSPTTNSSTTSAATIAPIEWACNACTFANSNTVMQCSMCESPRTGQGDANSAIGTATSNAINVDRNNHQYAVRRGGSSESPTVGPMLHSADTARVLPQSSSNTESELQNLQSSTMMGALAGGALSSMLQRSGNGSGGSSGGVLYSMLLGAGVGVLGGMLYNMMSSPSETSDSSCTSQSDENDARTTSSGSSSSNSSSGSANTSINNLHDTGPRDSSRSSSGRRRNALVPSAAVGSNPRVTTYELFGNTLRIEYSTFEIDPLSEGVQRRGGLDEEFFRRAVLLTTAHNAANDTVNSRNGRSGLSEEHIQRLNTHTVTDTDIASEKDCTCNICLDNFVLDETMKVLPCLHKFHDRCIDRWLRISSSCPLCKHVISTGS